jgi:hypothetical protein
MKQYRAGQWGPRGYYFERKSWKTLAVPKPGRILQGTEESTYIRLPIPPLLMALLGPLVGALYVVLFPLIGAFLLTWAAASGIWKIAVVAANGRPLRSKGDQNRPRQP